MTSSLVGSEMCIRDSPRGAAPTGREPARAGRQARREAYGGDGQAQRAVSYTHLTLPTICSV
eukprot:9664561-Prorocentrum_lima.AAC.1